MTDKLDQPNNSDDQKIGVLLANLGTPDSPSIPDVRRFLKEFLSDRRVIKAPRLIWWPILNFIILPFRPKRSAAAYQEVWTDDGSPLLVISKQQTEALARALDEKHPGNFELALAMRYGTPSTTEGLAKLKENGVDKVIVLPLYPQFSDTTTSSTRDAIEQSVAQAGYPPSFKFIEHYYDHPAYISALAASVREYWKVNGRAQKLIMSFHGIPEDYAKAGDPYPDHCRVTAKLLSSELALADDEWMLTFQSRLGAKKWLQPYTDKTLIKLAESGVRDVQIMCPGFSADCLETLEEIEMENRENFLNAGGERYNYIECLNTREDHIELMVALVEEQVDQLTARG